MSEAEIYDRFVEWLQKSWFGVPESEYMLKTVKATYSPDEAAFLTGIPFRPTPLAALAEQKQMDEALLGNKLDELACKGLVWRIMGADENSYYLNDLFFVIMRSAFWPGRQDEKTVEMARQTNKYYYNGMFKDLNRIKVGGLRTLPIETTIEDTREIRPYEDVVALLDRFNYYTVSNCPCRQRKKLDPDYEESKKPMEVCLHFDELGKYIVESGMGREVSREETEAILLQSAKAGLVHGVSNWEQKPDTI